MILELPNYVDEEICNRIRESVKPFLPFSKSILYNRDGKTVNISRNEELKDANDLLREIFINLQQNIVGLRFRFAPHRRSGDTGYEYHLYSPGEICHVHTDYEFSSGDPETTLRYASVVLHLNTVNEGGELVFPEQNKSVKTEVGKVVVFPPYGMFPHYTTPSKEPREIVVTWFVYSDVILKKI